MAIPRLLSAPVRVRMVVFAALTFALLLALPCVGNAQGKNSYGAKGRTIISGGLWGFKSTAETTDQLGHDATWSTWAHLTAAHFWIDNLAVGGTILGGRSHVDDDGYGEQQRTWVGGDLDVIGHLPLNPRLSLRLWVWSGLRWNESELRQDRSQKVVLADGGVVFLGDGPEARRTRTLSLASGVDLGLLVHLSPSVALTLGPRVEVDRKLTGAVKIDYKFSAGPGMTYSFGPGGEQHPSRFDQAQSFGKQGRRVLQLYGVFNFDKALSGVSLTRFVVDHFAVGAYASGGADRLRVTRNSIGGGLEALADLPVGASISVLANPRLGYMLTRVEEWTEYIPQQDGQQRYWTTVHQLQFALPIYLALHLYDGLVIGLGPALRCDANLATSSSRPMPNDGYLQVGLASTILGSF